MKIAKKRTNWKYSALGKTCSFISNEVISRIDKLSAIRYSLSIIHEPLRSRVPFWRKQLATLSRFQTEHSGSNLQISHLNMRNFDDHQEKMQGNLTTEFMKNYRVYEVSLRPLRSTSNSATRKTALLSTKETKSSGCLGSPLVVYFMLNGTNS